MYSIKVSSDDAIWATNVYHTNPITLKPGTSFKNNWICNLLVLLNLLDLRFIIIFSACHTQKIKKPSGRVEPITVFRLPICPVYNAIYFLNPFELDSRFFSPSKFFDPQWLHNNESSSTFTLDENTTFRIHNFIIETNMKSSPFD